MFQLYSDGFQVVDTSRRRSSKMDILVVDDDPMMAESIQIGLKRSGFRVLQATGAQQALDEISNKAGVIGIVVTDYLMPEMNGIDLLKAIRERHPFMPVIIMTAYAEKDMAIEAIRNSCDSIIEKPFRLDQLVAEIERVKLNLLQKANSNDLVRMVAHEIHPHLLSISESAQWILLNRCNGDAIHQTAMYMLESVRKIDCFLKKSMSEDVVFYKTVDGRGLPGSNRGRYETREGQQR
ncbi:MAG: response regulator [Desulfobacterales bacterium]